MKVIGDKKIEYSIEKVEIPALYHGTNRDFREFQPKGNDHSVFCTNSPQTASEFALYKTTWQGANVRPLTHPCAMALVVECDYENIRDIETRFENRVGSTLTEFARAHDSSVIQFKNVRDDAGSPYMTRASDVFQILDPSNLKPKFCQTKEAPRMGLGATF